MMKLKVIEVKVYPYNDYAAVTEVYESMSVVHHTRLRNTPKYNYPFVKVRQVLPPYKDITIRLDKLGLTERKTKVEYSYYFNESRANND
jgi:hypothetical protein